MIGPLTYMDAGLLALCLISGLLAMYRGLSRELLSIVSWLIAAAATVYVAVVRTNYSEQLANALSVKPSIAAVMLGAVVFVTVLIPVHLLTSRLSDTILDSGIGLIDRLLGFAFGVARGFIIVVVMYVFYESLGEPDEKKQFPWVRDAISRPAVQSTGQSISSMLRRYVPTNLSLPSLEKS
jgi:membrane protein required for colicin V production